MQSERILVAGIGNIFLGDDAFGVEVVGRLLRRPRPPCVRIVDFGIRGLDLTYALMDGYELVILVDAAPRGGQPGTLYVIEPELAALSEPGAPLPQMETHNLDPVNVLRLVQSMGGRVGRLLVVGCEPQTAAEVSDHKEMSMGLSPAVQAAIDEAVQIVESLVAEHLQPQVSSTAD